MQEETQPEANSPLNEKQPSNVKQKHDVEIVTIMKRSRMSNYPYYPVTFCLTQNEISYIFCLDFLGEDCVLSVTPFKLNKDKSAHIQMSASIVELDCLPKRSINLLYILSYQDLPGQNSKTMTITHIDFVVGFAAGFLVRCRYTNSTRVGSQQSKRQLVITGKFNKKPDYKQGFIMRMSSTFFGSDEFYKVAIEKPVRSFEQFRIKSNEKTAQKYQYSYLIGNRLFFSKQFKQQSESEVLRVFQNIEWDEMPQNSQAKLQKSGSTVIRSTRHRTLITSQSMLIQWTDEISSYVYTDENYLIVADNQENKIIIFDLLDNLVIKSMYKFDMDIKKLNYFKWKLDKEQNFLFIMPYDTNLFIINLSQNLIVSLSCHRSYISQAVLNQNGFLITGGCDHRIGLKSLKSIKSWTSVPLVKGNKELEHVTKHYEIDIPKVAKSKINQSFFQSEFNNVNEQRNNNASFGFGNFIHIPNTQLYAFITYDFVVKIYKIAA